MNPKIDTMLNEIESNCSKETYNWVQLLLDEITNLDEELRFFEKSNN